MPKLRPIVRSDGQEYPSMTNAAEDVSTTTGALWNAIQATKCGLKRVVRGFQWAYKGEVPEVWPEFVPCKSKPSKKPRSIKPVVESFSELPIYSPVFAEKRWSDIPGLFNYEVSSTREVRYFGIVSLLPRIVRGSVSLVRIHDRFYNIVDLMMLAFVGPKPHGYTVQKREGESEVLSNLFYGPRKPRIES